MPNKNESKNMRARFKRVSLPAAVIRALVIAGVIFLLVNPRLIPFIGDGDASAIEHQLAYTFSAAADDAGSKMLFSLPTLFTLLTVILSLTLFSWVARYIISALPLKSNRSRTVAGLASSLLKYVCVLVMIIWGLSIVGVNLTGIFASLGLMSLIVGFGAQSLIEDVITGIFIIFEGQYEIGDVIVLDDFRGVVRRIGVRTTTIEDGGGNLKIINNSDIRNLQNRSRKPSVAVCDVGVPYGADIEDIERRINENIIPAIAPGAPELLRDVEYAGVQQLGDSAVVLRIIAGTKEENIFAAQRALNRAVLTGFAREGIEIPFPQLDVHSK